MFPDPAPDAGLLAALREGLADAGFTEAAVRERYGLASINEFPLGSVRAGEPADALDVLIRLVMEGGVLQREAVAALLPPRLLAALEALEILCPAPADAAALEAVVALYPVEELYIVSDRGSEFPFGRADSVYPAINRSGSAYLGSLPRTPCERFLELCSGTGIAALVAARTAGHVWAIDITERSTNFARFNAALNGSVNFTALQGDLYAPAQGIVFDRIVAHPPYVPSLERRQIYRDGGADGEELTRRVVAEAPAYLAPGGRLYVTCVATERAGEPLETRVRRMLGPASDDFDVLVLVAGIFEPLAHFTAEVAVGRRSLEEASTLVKLLKEKDVTQFCSATILLEKHAGAAPPLTIRRRRGAGELGDTLDGLLRWHRYAGESGALERLATARPRLAPRARLQVLHQPRDGAWAVEACRVVVDGPLAAELDTSGAAAACLAWCDGERTVRDHLERLLANGAAPPDAPPAEFFRMILALLQEGVLEAELPAS
jgi:SAM-dependent methyltransferase